MHFSYFARIFSGRLALVAFLAGMLPFFNSCIGAGLQSEVYACNLSADCPPGDFFCDSYLNSYMYNKDTAAQPLRYGIWGHCNNKRDALQKPRVDDEKKYVSVEICDNGKDDDGNGKTDCGDPECVTAPHCRTRIQNTCGPTPKNPDSNIDCNELRQRSFPFIIEHDAVRDQCPSSVGHAMAVPSADPPFVCLPRCRLYLVENKQDNNDPAEFSGSDDYCSQILFEGNAKPIYWGEHKPQCQHLGFVKNHSNTWVQNDVCLPAPVHDCDGCDNCVEVNFKNRIMLTWAKTQDTPPVPYSKMIDGNDPSEFERTKFICLD